MPMPSRASPAPRQQGVNHSKILVFRPIAQSCEVGNQTDIPEQKRNSQIRADGENVPDQRTTKLRPYSHCVRIREKPVSREPRASGMKKREHSGASYGEKRH